MSTQIKLLHYIKLSLGHTMEINTTDIKRVNDALINLVDYLHQAKIEIKPQQNFLEIQSVKFAFHTATLIEIFKGTNINKVKFPDYNSLLLLFRAQLEAYLMFYYLNVQPISDDERELRLLLFEASGLNYRQKFSLTLQKHQLIKSNDLKRLQVIMSKIEINKYFLTLPSKRQKELVKNKPARLSSWVELIKSSHLKDNFFIDIWSLCSNYAHSEYLGLIQFKGYLFDKEIYKNSLTQLSLNVLILTSIICVDVVTMFPQIKDYYYSFDKDLIELIEDWSAVGKI